MDILTATSPKPIERKDSWTNEMDLKLKEIVFESLRQGKTQSNGFMEASNIIGKSKSACSFRFNTVIRKKFTEEFKQIKESKTKNDNESSDMIEKVNSDTFETLVSSNVNAPKLDAVIQMLQSMKKGNVLGQENQYSNRLIRVEEVVTSLLDQVENIRGKLLGILELCLNG